LEAGIRLIGVQPVQTEIAAEVTRELDKAGADEGPAGAFKSLSGLRGEAIHFELL
jgi:hypothetical protein